MSLKKPSDMTEMELVLARIKDLENRVSVLEKMGVPTRVKQEILPWLAKTVIECPPYAEAIKRFTTPAIRTDLLLTLKKQGLTATIMALWTYVFTKGASECPLRCFALSPSTLYGFDGEWKKMGQHDYGMLVRASEQWIIRAIKAECTEGSEMSTMLFAKVVDSSADVSRLRTRLCKYLQQSLKNIRTYEFEP